MTVYDVVKKLVGEINPIGEADIDDARFENLKAMTELVERLLTDINAVAFNEIRVEYSMKRAGDFLNGSNVWLCVQAERS